MKSSFRFGLIRPKCRDMISTRWMKVARLIPLGHAMGFQRSEVMELQPSGYGTGDRVSGQPS